MPYERKIVSGNSNRPLAEKIAEKTGCELAECEVSHFSDGEIFVQINENVRGADLFIVQSTNPPADNLMELLILIDAAGRASAMRITAVIPYFGYARSDRKAQPRVSIASKLMANIIVAAGADRVIRRIYARDRRRAYILSRYLEDMEANLREVFRVLRPGARYCVAVGNNTIRGQEVENWRYIAALGQRVGFRLETHFGSEIIRHFIKVPRAERIMTDFVIVLAKPGLR